MQRAEVLFTFADSLHGADFGAIFHAMDREIDLGQGLLLLYGADGIVDLDVAQVLRRRRASTVGIHGGRAVEGRRRGGLKSEGRRASGLAVKAAEAVCRRPERRLPMAGRARTQEAEMGGLLWTISPTSR